HIPDQFGHHNENSDQTNRTLHRAKTVDAYRDDTSQTRNCAHTTNYLEYRSLTTDRPVDNATDQHPTLCGRTTNNKQFGPPNRAMSSSARSNARPPRPRRARSSYRLARVRSRPYRHRT